MKKQYVATVLIFFIALSAILTALPSLAQSQNIGAGLADSQQKSGTAIAGTATYQLTALGVLDGNQFRST
jgi:hypothetical protein